MSGNIRLVRVLVLTAAAAHFASLVCLLQGVQTIAPSPTTYMTTSLKEVVTPNTASQKHHTNFVYTVNSSVFKRNVSSTAAHKRYLKALLLLLLLRTLG